MPSTKLCLSGNYPFRRSLLRTRLRIATTQLALLPTILTPGLRPPIQSVRRTAHPTSRTGSGYSLLPLLPVPARQSTSERRGVGIRGQIQCSSPRSHGSTADDSMKCSAHWNSHSEPQRPAGRPRSAGSAGARGALPICRPQALRCLFAPRRRPPRSPAGGG